MASARHNRNPAHPPEWVRALWNTPWLWLAFIVPLFCVPLFVGLDHTDLENDEAIYSFAVETMLKDGDWLTPKSIPSETSAFLEKPPLKFWLTALPIHFGWLPANEYGLRFVDAALSAVAFLYVFLIGRRLAGPVCGLTAVLLLFTHDSLLYHHGLRSNNMESTTVLAYAAGVYHFMAWRSINPDVKRHVYAMSLWFVLAFMTKFVAGLFLPVILGAAALVKREDRGRLFRDWPTFALAGLLAVALIVPWFVHQYFERGPRLFDIMFGGHVLKRFTSYLDPQHLQPWHYYFTQLWTELGRAGTRLLIVTASILFAVRTWRHRWIEGLVIILWFAIPVAAISAGTSKLYHYLYPFLAPLALAGGWLIAAIARRLYLWIARPVDTIVAKRDALLPAAMKSTSVQIALTIAGLVSLLVAAATATYDRLQIRIGSLVLRNTSEIRPVLAAGVAWLVGAPSQVLRSVVVGLVLAVVLPLGAYKDTVTMAKRTDRRLQQLRACLAPIVAERVAQGRGAPGFLVDAQAASFISFYYLRTFGEWQQAATISDETIVEYLSSPTESRPMILSANRYRDVVARLSADRSSLFSQHSIGLVILERETVVLPGPYATCGVETARVISR